VTSTDRLTHTLIDDHIVGRIGALVVPSSSVIASRAVSQVQLSCTFCRSVSVFKFHYSAPDRGSMKYCNKHVCLSDHISKATRRSSANFCVCFVWPWCIDTLRILSGLLDIIFVHKLIGRSTSPMK